MWVLLCAGSLVILTFFFVRMFVVAQFLLNVADVRHFKNLFSVWKGIMEEVPTRYFNLLTIILKPILII